MARRRRSVHGGTPPADLCGAAADPAAARPVRGPATRPGARDARPGAPGQRPPERQDASPALVVAGLPTACRVRYHRKPTRPVTAADAQRAGMACRLREGVRGRCPLPSSVNGASSFSQRPRSSSPSRCSPGPSSSPSSRRSRAAMPRSRTTAYRPSSTSLLAPVGLAALLIVRRQKAAWMAVPALWPSLQPYYTTLGVADEERGGGRDHRVADQPVRVVRVVRPGCAARRTVASVARARSGAARDADLTQDLVRSFTRSKCLCVRFPCTRP